MNISFEPFVTSFPSHQNAVDLFQGSWVSELPVAGMTSGNIALFADTRPRMAEQVCGSLEGFKVLELGPLEGAHAYLLEQLGVGSIVAIEASPQNYLKSLITKEILGLKAHFLLGEFNKYMEETEERFDLVFACGVLYHMTDPLHTLKLISEIAPRVYIWAHYLPEPTADLAQRSVERYGFSCTYHELTYDASSHNRTYSGVSSTACWLLREDILGALKFFGFDRVTVVEDTPDHQDGPAFSVVAERTRDCRPAVG